jgi:hypothetical protein
VQENIYLSKLAYLKHTYLQVSPEKLAEIDSYVREKLPGASADAIEQKKNKLVDANLQINKNDLIRRVHPWLASEIENSLPELIEGLQSAQPAQRKETAEKASALFNDIKIQNQKNLIIHTIGLIAVVITLAGLIAGCIACPAIIPFVLLIIGSVFATARYYLHHGLMDSKGWKFSVSNCIPSAAKWIYKKITGAGEILTKPPETISFEPIRCSYILPGSIAEKNRMEYQKTLAGMSFRMA